MNYSAASRWRIVAPTAVDDHMEVGGINVSGTAFEGLAEGGEVFEIPPLR